ncbi:alpha-ketoglutarate-dependent dioxygenase AlkB [Cellulophaga sp. E16_2]|uniref:Alkylated DNA repair protein-like protein n=1 Tax=Cellulophaga algicola (strain DSM 14237 / IC166 / ACAM 630) TaxID=688270 RepID=E6XD31_CELAD|nr:MULTISPECIES: alpha-ketoglutarate-dependent dioxygenase AlkB [Cellulophaga]ADV51218.1 alkylated DNA repair protein-like protein [Cellulophaga algicola DSM 14237]MBO0593605.1 alpha-ketoglutarate-dependent dioxygenase AlkB [Cellulophaga sp. E16_2]
MDLFNQTDLFSTDEIRKTEFDMPGADVTLFENFFSKEESGRLYTSLLKNTNWEQDQLVIYGKEIDLPRLTAWYGDTNADDSYANTKRSVRPWTEDLLYIKARIEEKVDVKFTRCLLNYYRDGEDSVNWHQDYTGEERKNTVIGSVTFGATRPFQLKHATRKDVKRIDIPLAHGSLLLMQGATQENWMHKIPKTTKKIQPRINLTFRWVK